MDPDAFTGCHPLFKWDPRVVVATAASTPPPPPPPPPHQVQQQHHHQQQDMRQRELEEVLGAYGIRYVTAAKIAELGFTVNTLVDMKEEEVDEMMNSLCHIFRWELLVGERYGIKAAIRAHKRRLGLLPPTVEDFHDYNSSSTRRRLLHPPSDTNALDNLSQEGLSEEPVQQDKDGVGTGSGEANYQRRKHRRRRKGGVVDMDGDNQQIDDEEDHDVDDGQDDDEEGDLRRQREHPFIVTEPGEVARGKKNGLDYLFHLYEQCREFLIQVQNMAKERGEKCPTKVTNQVFRFAKKAGASYINKPKMRHYVHCYALHCLDEEASNAIRRAFKERGENVGAWRQACYRPLVAIAARRANWDIDAIFNAHPRLSIWYVPTKLRQLCHAERSSSTSVSPSPPVPVSALEHHLPLPSSSY